MTRFWSRSFPHTLATISVIAIIVSASMPALAQPATPSTVETGCTLAAEPNDQPTEATDLGSGSACGSGEYPGGGHDLYRWTVSDAEASSRWSFVLTPIVGQVGLIEIYDVDLDDAGTILGVTKLVSATGDPGEPIALSGLLWLPGEYYLGVA